MIDWWQSLGLPFVLSPFLGIAILLFVTLPVLLFQYFQKYLKKRSTGTLKYSSFQNLKKIRPGLRVVFRHTPFLLRVTALLCLILALARPQKGKEGTEINSEGVNILLAIDRSSSMMAMDFTTKGKPSDRLEAVKEVVQKFVNKRQSDALGLVVFAGYADLQCPLTLDYNIISSLVSDLSIVTPNSGEDGTAIGDAIGLGVLRFKDVKAESKILILLTDGENTAGEMAPIKAAELAKKYGIKIFTIGAGTKGTAPYMVQGFFGKELKRVKVNIDEKTLKEIARITEGKYFRATDTQSLEEIYSIIDKMTKTQHSRNIFTEYTELFHYFIWFALGFLFLEVFLSNTWLRKLP